MIDYAQVLAIINASDNPAGALQAFVEQEREHERSEEARRRFLEEPVVRPKQGGGPPSITGLCS